MKFIQIFYKTLLSVCTLSLVFSSYAFGMWVPRKKGHEKRFLSQYVIIRDSGLNNELKDNTKINGQGAELRQVLVDTSQGLNNYDFHGDFDPKTNYFLSGKFPSYPKRDENYIMINIWDIDSKRFITSKKIENDCFLICDSSGDRGVETISSFKNNLYILREKSSQPLIFTNRLEFVPPSKLGAPNFEDSLPFYPPRKHRARSTGLSIIIDEIENKDSGMGFHYSNVTKIQEFDIAPKNTSQEPLKRNPAEIESFCFSKTNGLLAICTSHGDVQFWNWQENKKQYVFLKNLDLRAETDSYWYLHLQANFSPNGRYFIVKIHETGRIKIIDCENNEFSLIQSIEIMRYISSFFVVCHPTKNLFAIGFAYRNNKLNQCETKIQIWQLPEKPNAYKKIFSTLNKKNFDDTNFIFADPRDNV